MSSFLQPDSFPEPQSNTLHRRVIEKDPSLAVLGITCDHVGVNVNDQIIGCVSSSMEKSPDLIVTLFLSMSEGDGHLN